MLKRVKDVLVRFGNDDGGVVKLEYLLIVAAIALPLLGLLLFYRKDIGDWVADKWEQYRAGGRTEAPVASPY